jgi:hypothetical protein
VKRTRVIRLIADVHVRAAREDIDALLDKEIR